MTYEIKNLQSIINENNISGLISDYSNVSDEQVDDIINKALELKGIETFEAAVLINLEDDKNLQKLFNAATKIKNEIYGKRMVIFAPMYISSYCSNNCLYCGFRSENNEIERIHLTSEQVTEETLNLLRQGHKRILLLSGEHRKMSSLDTIIEMIDSIYSVKDEKGSSIRRINVEIAPLTDEGFKRLSSVKIGTYTVFQETYHKDTYEKVHLKGPKADYHNRLEVMDRALSNGMHDVGIGALFGLYDYKFETLAMIEHAKHLDDKFSIGPHTISIPRIKPANNAPISRDLLYDVSDKDLMKIVAVLRCTVPYTGIILSTRETSELRDTLFELGISQVSAGSKTNPGAYSLGKDESLQKGQFGLNDCRSSGEVISDLIKKGYIPSFCTGCYRKGRVGKDFMDIAKPGLIKLHCLPNALTTLKEYLEDYADDKTKEIGKILINSEMKNIPSLNRQRITLDYLNSIECGSRDLYF